jgi:hypothetical protein
MGGTPSSYSARSYSSLPSGSSFYAAYGYYPLDEGRLFPSLARSIPPVAEVNVLVDPFHVLQGRRAMRVAETISAYIERQSKT